MKKLIVLMTAVLAMLACSSENTPERPDIQVNPPVPEGALVGAFSVSDGKQVHFSPGNLQYQASTDTWRFAENQWDIIGNANENISASYEGWIDLFGWGTGKNPTLASDKNEDYATFTDWGANKISNGGSEANLWRTLTTDEWIYLFKGRRDATSLFGMGTVNGVNGVILLPDNWRLPFGLFFASSAAQGLKDYGLYYRSNQENNALLNTYTTEQWSYMEARGAVFLPAAGRRDNTSMSVGIGMSGPYWSATPQGTTYAYSFICSYSSSLILQSTSDRSLGLSVRLVR